ncbi:MAG: response regulator [Microbacterium sp.]|jgi:hypothetical protein|uniref:response regulator n=1 Tax=Microbacterium sp. TaxID=51671 RepID=UPI002628EA00|nr:response regulator [Microbacterium sp.]MDF2561200.1 response regulator [Microbacterium sp.]
MYVSVEVITMLATAAATLVAIVSGFGWMITRMDARFNAVDAKFEAQDAKFEARFERIDRRLDRVENEIFEVKIAIARLEGPTPRLVAAR